MHFLPDVWVECDVCKGSRYNPETLAVRYKGRSIAEILHMRVSEAVELFTNIPRFAGSWQPWPTSAWITCRWGKRLRPSPAARPSVSSWPPSYPAPTPAGRSTFSMSPRPACTSTTFASCWTFSTGWWTWAIPLSSWSTTWT